MARISNSTARPEVSVITVVFNGAAHLEQCIRSVQTQTDVCHEHIVIDGGSTDGSAELVRRHADGLSCWISEPDCGIGDAMNKGIALSQGKWLLFLHADDYLLSPDSLAACTRSLAHSHADIVCFPIHFGLPGQFRELQPRCASFWLNLKMGMPHQGCFTRRTLFERLGGFDTSLRVDMDYDFVLRAWRAGAVFETINTPAPSFMRATGISSHSDWSSLQRRYSEERTIHFRHANSGALRLLYRLYWPAYLSYRWMRWRLDASMR